MSALLVLGAMASCSSSQLAYQFRPAPSGQVQQPVAATPAEHAAVQPAAAPSAAQPTLVQIRKQQKHVLSKAQVRRLERPVAALVRATLPATSATQAATKPRISAPVKVRQAFAPQQPAEVGLGTTVLGVLGLIVLPLSLLGLLIWGGPVWLVLAGLSALAVLIAYLDPFG
ncbi:hypothetical protein [Hymenobacter sp. BT190]|uniref:hypothetical protein n=1 Tax=Hymenobacter sp. BT190 TaxID=2763505 RepID=UPI0016515C8D|nr:hypothetical protein [Hymenobacter sp. BT190]MBC6700019.1 hypothetical protein [Hymenobacter sp. BT190]